MLYGPRGTNASTQPAAASEALTDRPRGDRKEIMKYRIALAALACLLSSAFVHAEPPKSFDAQQPVPHGRVEKLTYPSKTLGFDRPVVIYTPPGYTKDSK